MRIFIAGATGVLGRRLVQQLHERGHEVVGLARSEAGERRIGTLGGISSRADLFDAEALARAAEGSEVVIHAATAIPTKQRPGPSDWAMNDRIRREGTRALTTAAAKVGAKLYLQQSITWIARPPDGSPFDEDSPTYPDPVTRSALDGELIAREAGERSGFATGVLRCGLFYGADSAHTRLLGDGLTKRRIPIVGRGDAIWTNLHLDDAAGAFVAAAEAGRGGLWHVVDDEPVTVARFLMDFAERLGAPPPRRVPVWLARLLAGQTAVNFLRMSMRTTNARFRREVGWTPRFPSYRAGLDQIVAAWQAERFVEGPTRERGRTA
jgi:nucleoside-diphosphate-sugar epimerase